MAFVSGWTANGDAVRYSPYSSDMRYARSDHTIPAQNTENGMAKRKDFLFTYTGAQIADAIGDRMVGLENKIQFLAELDVDALSDVLMEDFGRLDGKQRLENKSKYLEDQLSKLRKERVVYADAGAKEFELDLEDVGYFGLAEA